jgi:hypothetical protein
VIEESPRRDLGLDDRSTDPEYPADEAKPSPPPSN